MGSTRTTRSASDRRPLRQDALRNRELLVAAAKEVFTQDGLDAPLERIAERAGVGIATLYRRFPARDDLLDAVVDDLVDGYAAMLRDAASTAGTWEGFCAFLERAFELHAGKRGLVDVLAREPSDARRRRLARRRAELRELQETILEAARTTGGLRPDFTREDLVLLFWAQGRIAEATEEVAPGAWRRHLELVLDALRADRATPLVQPPLTSQQIEAAAARLRHPRRRQAPGRAGEREASVRGSRGNEEEERWQR